MNEIISPKCPKCGVALPADAPQGLCPRCLGALNLATETLLTGEDAVAALPPLTPEELAPHFPQLEIIECLGRGGMGVVYKARQKSLNRLVALKLLAPEREKDEAFAGHFAHEAHALAGLNHPNIVTVYDFGQAGGFFFLLMEFVDGVNLRQAMKVGHFTPEQALAIVPPICDALQYAHEHGIVHRDIKPENLLLDKGGRVKIADFGIAKIVASVYDRRRLSPEEWRRSQTAATTELTDAGRVMGTPQYMAPEQKEHRATDHRADIYSLGVVLYEMLTGELPADKLQPPSRKVQIDVRLDEIVLRALEKSPELRYQTAGEFRTRVETMAQTPPAIPSAAIRTEGGSSDVSANQRAVEAARRMVAAPATCLLVVGCLNLLFFLMCCLWFPFFTIRSDSGHPIITHYNSPQPATLGTTGLLLILYFSALVMLVFSALNMRRLQHYGMSVAASILAMITPPGFLLGLPFGIWSLIVLARRDVREAFESPVPPKLPWPRRKLIKVGGSLLGAAGLILLGAGIICFAWPRSYSARCVFEITDWSAEKGATAVQLATRGMAARKDYSLDVLVIRGTDLVQVTAWAKDPRTAADAANAAYDRVKTGFANLPNEKLTLREKAAPPATYSKPNIPGIIGVTSFLLVPPFALPGIILLLVGLFRQGDKAQEVGRNGHESRAQNATTRTDSDSGDSAANQRTVETAQRMVAAPATCLLVVGCLNLLFFLMCCSWFLLTTRSDSGQPNISNHDLPQPATAATAGLPLILYFCAMVMLVFSALNMRRLQHYGMSVAGSILAMITPPGFLLGLPFGIWSLIVLARRDVREAFEFAVPPPRPPKPPWPRKRLIKTGTSLLGAAGLILLGAGIICWAWPRSYSARCVISTNGSSGLKAATVIQYATQGTPTPKDYSLEMVAIRNTSLVQVTAWANDPRTAADAANAAWDRVKAGFANKPDERVTLIEKAEPPATYAKPNIRGIIRVTAFFLVPPFALPGIILLLVGLFRRGEKTPPPLEGNEAEWRNPANWTGPVYFSKRDSRVWVPKRGHPAFGWTVNFGRAWGLALIACILLAGLVISNSFIGYFAAKQKPATGKTLPPATPSEPSRVSHTGPPFVAQLAQGTVELIGVAPHPSANASSWYPDGSPSKKRFPSPRMVLDDESQAEGKIMKEIAFRVHSRVGLRSTPVVHFDKESGVSEEGTESNFEEDSDGQTRSILVLSIACPPEAKKMNLKIKVASGDWEKALTLGKLGSASSSGRSGSTRSGWTKVGTWELHAETITGKDGDVTLALNSSGGDDFETRMVSVKTDGTVSPVQGKSSHSVGGVISSLIKMTADEYSQIKEFQLQKRPYQWVEFRNVSLQLGHKTLVEIVNAPGSETSQVAPAATFGPVIERVIRSDSFLNLDTGNYVEPPKEILDKMGIRFAAGASKIIEDDRRITEWAQASGADLTPGIPEKEGSMALWGGILSPNGSVRLKFDTATPGDVSSQLDETEERLTQGVKPLPTLTWLGGASFGSTFLFQTREGSRGLLQFLGSGPKGGIRVRYKLVQGTGGSRAR